MNHGIRFATVLFLFSLLGLSVSRAETTNTRNSVYELPNLVNTVRVIQKFKPKVTCEEKNFVRNSAKFLTTYNAEGKPCKIYDLSFPTVASLMKRTPVALVPVQKLTRDDYTAWFHGNFESVYNKLGNFDSNGQLTVAAANETDIKESWYAKLRFKDQRANPALNLKSLGQGSSELLSFKLSDLQVGRNFKFSPAAQRELLNAANELYAVDGMHTMSAGMAELTTIVQQPEKLLEKVSFNWNEARKVFEVFTEFDFLPLNGPIDLVDYNIQHKYFIEKTIRSLFLKAFSQLVFMIPEPATRNIVQLALGESFTFIEKAYEYHRNELEDTLRLNLNQEIKTQVATADLEKGINLIFAGNVDVLNEFMMAQISGAKFDLSSLDRKGAAIRYTVEKNRDITRPRVHSALALKKGCTMSLIRDNFGVCHKNGKADAVYSLMSEHTIYMWSLGAPMVFSYEYPAAVTMKRLASYMMAMVLQAVPMPIPGFITSEAIGILKGFANAGMADEAYLLNYLTEMKRNNYVSYDDKQDLVKWLFAQNINPFLVKREKTEDRLIEVNYGRILEKVKK